MLVTFRVKNIVSFCVKKLLHFALKSCYILRPKLLHFGLMLHFASKVVTFRVNVTFCVNCYILRRNSVSPGRKLEAVSTARVNELRVALTLFPSRVPKLYPVPVSRLLNGGRKNDVKVLCNPESLKLCLFVSSHHHTLSRY